MARDTLPRIRESALALFSERWFSTVSVAEICRRAEVSNGVFYRYYRSKEELFRSLVDEFLDRFAADLRLVGGDSFSDGLHRFIITVTGAAGKYAGQVSMFREAQYRERHYEDRLREVYIETIERLYRRQVSELEYLYLISGLRFLATRALYHDIDIDTRLVLDFLTSGVFPDTGAEPVLPSLPEPQDEPGQGAADRMLSAGMDLFGREGFHPVQVSDIVRTAGYSVGTFYKHFVGKEEFLGRIVDEIGHRTRRYISEHVPRSGSRWTQEVLGMWSFLAYFRRHPAYYEIVREAEFVVPDRVKEYYDTFERGYCGNLPDHAPHARALAANFLMGISHYLGIEVIFAGRIQDPAAAVRELGRLLRSGIPR